jgi:signal peptidase I
MRESLVMPERKSGGIRETLKTLVYAVAIALAVRTFLFEPFNIPSGSMKPTLLVGDYLFVSKFAYGYSRYSLPLGLPLFSGRIMERLPERGDVVVFKLPSDNKTDYIKRVVGLPGDRIAYRGKRISVNGTEVQVEGKGYYTDAELNFLRLPTFAEKLGEKTHQMMIVPAQPPVDLAQVRQFAHRSNCEYNDDGFSCTVPAGQYFMMGDNRDQSSDSRYWGFVPDDHIKGRAFLVWMNFNDFKRIGNGIE